MNLCPRGSFRWAGMPGRPGGAPNTPIYLGFHCHVIPHPGALHPGGEPLAALYVPVPGHIRRLQGSIERISSALREKVREGLLFSDRAMSELNFLFEKTGDIMANTRDMLLARNTLIADYIKESEASLARSANDFSTRISPQGKRRGSSRGGLPRASSVYLEMLEAFKGIAGHSKEIARGPAEGAKAQSVLR